MSRSPNFTQRFQSWRRRFARAYLRRFPATRFWATLYYAVLDDSFRREQVAVFAGKKEHFTGRGGVDPARFTLRRNVHRLEKALIMRPRRAVFARDYIAETVEAYGKVVTVDRRDQAREPELKWFTDVLARYFDTVQADEPITKLKQQFTRLGNGTVGVATSAPYPCSQLDEHTRNLSFDDLYQLFRRRRSTRWFLDAPVPRELIDRAILAALQAPSACNRQPFELRVIDDPELRRRVANIPMGTGGYADNLPAVVVVVGKLHAYFDERDRHLIYVDGSLAAMCFMLALVTLGLASCPINWPDVEAREQLMDQALGLTPWERPIMLIGVGYPDPEGGIPFSEKSPLAVMRRYN